MYFLLQYTTIIISALFLVNAATQEDKSAPIENNGKQSKRGTSELSYSYAATDIGSKGGTHVKTITIIKNFAHKDKHIKINPELHKDEDWGSKIRDNFDSFGKIPEIPEIPQIKQEEPMNQKEVKEEIPIQELTENEEVQENQAEEKLAEGKDANDEDGENKEGNKENMEPCEEKKSAALISLPDDVEIIDKSSLKIQNKQNLKSQPLISLLPRGSKTTKYNNQPSSLHIRPYHLLAKDSSPKPIYEYIEPKNISPPPTDYTPYKVPEIYKPITYSPLLFPSLTIQPNINKNPYLISTSATTPILPNNGNGNSQIISTSSTAPYIAPNIKKPLISLSSTVAPPFAKNEVSNLVNGKLSNKRVVPSSRSRGLRYKRESIK